jgi:hypothetical protein
MTAPSTGWHAGPEDLARYASGRLDHTRASSVEAHLVACAACRRDVATLVDTSHLDAVWDDVVDAIDLPRPRLGERVLMLLGLEGHTARLLAATPSLQLSWVVAVVLTLAFSVVAAGRGGPGPAVFLVVAPMLPLAGVAAAFGPGFDPAYELTMSTPMVGLRLLLLRAAAVFVVTVLLAGCAALALPAPAWTAVAWLLPALGLTLASLALATAVRPHHAALVVGTAWVAAVFVSAQQASDWRAPFGPAGQAACATVVLAAAAVVTFRHQTLDPGRLP